MSDPLPLDAPQGQDVTARRQALVRRGVADPDHFDRVWQTYQRLHRERAGEPLRAARAQLVQWEADLETEYAAERQLRQDSQTLDQLVTPSTPVFLELPLDRPHDPTLVEQVNAYRDELARRDIVVPEVFGQVWRQYQEWATKIQTDAHPDTWQEYQDWRRVLENFQHELDLGVTGDLQLLTQEGDELLQSISDSMGPMATSTPSPPPTPSTPPELSRTPSRPQSPSHPKGKSPATGPAPFKYPRGQQPIAQKQPRRRRPSTDATTTKVRLITEVDRIDRQLQTQTLPASRVRALQQRLANLEDELAALNTDQSSDGASTDTVRRRGNQQSVTTATSRERLGTGDHRTTTTTRTVTTVRKGQRPVVRRNSRSISTDLSSSSSDSSRRRRPQRGRGQDKISQLIAHLRRKHINKLPPVQA